MGEIQDDGKIVCLLILCTYIIKSSFVPYTHIIQKCAIIEWKPKQAFWTLLLAIFFLNGYAFLNLYPMITGRELFLLLNNMIIMLKDRIDIDTFTLICRTHTLNTIICLYHINPCTYFFGIQVKHTSFFVEISIFVSHNAPRYCARVWWNLICVHTGGTVL